MKNWQRRIEDVSIYILYLLLFPGVLLVRSKEVSSLILFPGLVGFAAVSEWLRRGPMLEKLKVYMERNGIRIIHLWIGVTVVYYLFVGMLDLFRSMS